MGPASRFFIFITVGIISLVIGGQTLFNRFPIEQALRKVRTGIPISGDVLPSSEDSIIPLRQIEGALVARVEFNDLYDAQLIVDTGATFTTISEDLAFDAGISKDPPSSSIELSTFSGKVKVQMGMARKIRVGNVGRNDVQVVVHTIPNLPKGIDGLLGLTFFDRFLVRLDQSKGQLRLTPRN